MTKAELGALRRRNSRGEGEKLRPEIIAAATRLLSDTSRPFSLRAVAKEAGISAPAVYLHFADGDALFFTVLEDLFSQKIAMFDALEEEAAARGGGAWDRLLARSFAHVRYALENSGHYKVLYEGRVVPFMNSHEVAGLGKPLHIRAVRLIDEIIAQSPVQQISQDPSRLAIILWSGLHGMVSLRINKPTFEWPDAFELAEQITRATVRL